MPSKVVAKLLDSIGFDRDPLKTAWDGMLAELVAYKEQTGGFKQAGMRKELQVWVSRQRAQRKLVDQPGTKSGMTKDKIEALGEIDFPWAIYQPRKKRKKNAQ